MGEGHVGPVVGEVGDGDGGGAVGEGQVLGLKDLLCDFGCGDGEGVDGPKLEVEDATVLVGQMGQATVGEFVDEVEVADDG